MESERAKRIRIPRRNEKANGDNAGAASPRLVDSANEPTHHSVAWRQNPAVIALIDWGKKFSRANRLLFKRIFQETLGLGEYWFVRYLESPLGLVYNPTRIGPFPEGDLNGTV
jgi:hypothetical protein